MEQTAVTNELLEKQTVRSVRKFTAFYGTRYTAVLKQPVTGANPELVESSPLTLPLILKTLSSEPTSSK